MPEVDPPSTLRLFVALAPPAAMRERLHAAAAPLRALLGGAVSWTPADRLHLTLRFLGAQPERVVRPLADALAMAAAPVPPLELATAGGGAFPGTDRPRVLWIGLTENVHLATLYHRVDDACAALGFGREPRAWRPHLTLGRFRDARGGRGGGAPAAGAALRAALDALRPALAFPLDTLDLMASTLTPAGARHTRLAALPLGAAPLGAAPMGAR